MQPHSYSCAPLVLTPMAIATSSLTLYWIVEATATEEYTDSAYRMVRNFGGKIVWRNSDFETSAKKTLANQRFACILVHDSSELCKLQNSK